LAFFPLFPFFTPHLPSLSKWELYLITIPYLSNGEEAAFPKVILDQKIRAGGARI
jgi:hypothetical protein